MKILIPDAQFSGDSDIEKNAFNKAVDIEVYRCATAQEIPAELWGSCDALLAWQDIAIDKTVVSKLDNCKIIVRCGIGYDRVNVKVCGARGIPVCNVPTYDFTDVMSSTLAMALALMRGLFTYDGLLKSDFIDGWEWGRAPEMRRVRDQNFGVVGCGRIGTGVLLRAKGFGMSVGYYDPYLPTGHEKSLDLKRFETLDDLLSWADVLSIHTPLNSETDRLINQQAVAHMKPGAIFVNCARGGLVDLDALEWGLREGPIAAAALDVFAEEPPGKHPLITAWLKDADWIKGRLIITPHSSFFSDATFIEIRQGAASTAAQYLEDRKLINCVNERYMEW